jgi:hypothetical protein
MRFKEHDYGVCRNYAWEKRMLPNPEGDDFETWEYMNRNAVTGMEFTYKIIVTKTALSCTGLPRQIQDAIDTEGESIVREWLTSDRQEDLVYTVSEKEIKEGKISDEKIKEFTAPQWNVDS